MSSLTVYFKRFDSTLPIPEYKSSGAAAFDLYARQTVTIEPLNIGYIPLNIALQLPDDHWALVSARSSLHKRGLFLANGIGVGDHDFCGPDDEYKAPVFNFTNQSVIIDRGERVVQMIILQRDAANLVEKADFMGKSRGGFGTTGRK